MSRQRKAKKEHFPIGNAKNATFEKSKKSGMPFLG